MSFLEGFQVYILTLLKITYEFGLSLLILLGLMSIASLIKGDKCLFTKAYKRLRRYMLND